MNGAVLVGGAGKTNTVNIVKIGEGRAHGQGNGVTILF
ncbi:MAG: hypothetical protein BWY80_01283 [Firmicutes bacterium ADurb.Bin456]|nr:MAG: hypothetical protein BWY80_01283 [Firmicutes bacterium ADurb.Bin456]